MTINKNHPRWIVQATDDQLKDRLFELAQYRRRSNTPVDVVIDRKIAVALIRYELATRRNLMNIGNNVVAMDLSSLVSVHPGAAPDQP